ncbi:3-oxoacyl-[acyl-carrier-protein] synthase-3/clorobiocin biosynthesis protein CloN2 [Asanoa ferruginea]|uniref:3-oxoacyl-[acyl-carrier-protein] synthase-3/clorobiocin biosynthesis protein CloN2 n=1 Tax=Asanoa ferruginea TaxID=53367 RepID=A0A3D9ZNX2_9ACTN|nr:ketoacyl-ACP synthase III family protein [Asanoa ferruginea]REF98887.1 3-oxoacyl-[acyl-carrier-protein] synthase-3/clorobiocin biosynthesis protein CloN2 [Asanoa ferruginea]GIF46431.1 hypothetical protein Afe04nite_09700 [Asanoa ferruginea]
MKAHDIWLAGTGVYLPASRYVAQSDGTAPASTLNRTNNRRTRVAIAGDISAPDMALTAARRALAAARAHPADVALLLYASVWHQGPDGWGPHHYLQHHLGLDHSLALEVRGGCTGTFGAIDLSIGYLNDRSTAETALVIASDNFGTKLVDRWCMGPLSGAVGDGAAAVLLSRTGGLARILSSAGTTFSEMEEVYRGDEPLFPPPVTEGRYLDFGARAAAFQRRAMREGSWLRLITDHRAHVQEVVEEALADAEIGRGDIRKVLVNTMPESTAKDYLDSFGFTLEQSSWAHTEALGHLGAGDHFVALHEMLAAGALRPGDRVLLTGFSPGITYKAMVIEITMADPS